MKKFFNKKRRGFTLIEIIISIIIITLVAGSVTVLTITKKKNIIKTLENNAPKFENALQVYLETHEDIIKNINNNAKGAIVTLEVLKNEGLIKDDLDIDYKKQYYLLSNAYLAPPDIDTSCDAEQVSLAVVESWNVDTDNVIYVCSNDNSDEMEDLNERVSSLENNSIADEIAALREKINSLESSFANVDIGADNWVIFNVNSDSTKEAYWPSSGMVPYQDHWQIISSERNEGNYNYRLLYNTNVLANNEKLYSNVNNGSLTANVTYSYDLYSCTKYKTNGDCSTWTQNIDKNSVYRLSNNFAVPESSNYDISTIRIYNNQLYKAEKRYSSNTYRLVPVNNNFTLDVKNYYRKQNSSSEFTKFQSVTEWDLHSIINGKTDTSGTKKNMLYNQIPSVLRSKLLKKDYFYKYLPDDTKSTISRIDTSSTFNDKLGLLSINDVNDISKYIGRNIFSGVYNFDNGFNNYNGIIALNNGQIAMTKLNETFSENIIYSERELEVNNGSSVNYPDGKYYYTSSYTPVITVGSGNLVLDIDVYKTQMGSNYSSCTREKLGQKSCPYLIKFSDGTYSNAT